MRKPPPLAPDGHFWLKDDKPYSRQKGNWLTFYVLERGVKYPQLLDVDLFLDTGSNHSLIDEELHERLGYLLLALKEPLNIVSATGHPDTLLRFLDVHSFRWIPPTAAAESNSS